MVDLSTVRAVAGDWIGVRGEHVLAVVGPEASRSAARLWVAVDGGADFDEALDVLVRGGLGELGDFALVATGVGGRARVLVRGGARVEVTLRETGTELVDAGGLVWREARFDDVVALRVECGGFAQGPADSFGAGLRRVGGVLLGADPVVEPSEPSEPSDASEAADDERPAATPVVLVAHPSDDGPEAGAEVEPEPEPAPEVDSSPAAAPAAPHDEFDDLETAPLVAAPALAPAPVVAAVPEFPGGAESWQDDVTSHIAPVGAPLDVPGVPTPAASTPVGVEGADATELPTGATEVLGAGRSPAEPTRVEPVGRATFSHGLVVEVDRPYVVGRAPSLRPGLEDARAVTVPSPLGEISATHVEIRPGAGADAGRIVVVDLGSTNGTLVLRTGQTPLELLPGVPFVLAGEAVVDLGDGATIQLRGR